MVDVRSNLRMQQSWTSLKKSTLHLGLARAPVESGQRVVWMILLLIRGGLDALSVPIFLDRGNLLAASRILSRDHSAIVSVKFCLERLIRSVLF